MTEEDETRIVHCFPRNSREAVCVGISTYQGKTYVFIRCYAPALTGDDLIPLKKGISLAISKCGQLVEGVRALGDVMSSNKLVARIKKNNQQEIRIATSEYAGHHLIDIRTYGAYGDSAELSPMKKGVSMNVELYPKLLEAVEKLEAAVVALGVA